LKPLQKESDSKIEICCNCKVKIWYKKPCPIDFKVLSDSKILPPLCSQEK
jgi:hypothetical protein